MTDNVVSLTDHAKARLHATGAGYGTTDQTHYKRLAERWKRAYIAAATERNALQKEVERLTECLTGETP